MRVVLFVTIFLIVFMLLNLYISKRLIAKLDLKKNIKSYLNIFLVINFIGIIGYMVARYYVDISNWLYFLVSIPMGILFLLFCTTLIYDISRVLLTKMPISHSRRKFFKKSLDISSLVMATALSARSIYEARFVQIEKVNIKINNLKQSYKIVQLSDLHIGGLINAKFIKDIVQRINKLNAHLVVITVKRTAKMGR